MSTGSPGSRPGVDTPRQSTAHSRCATTRGRSSATSPSTSRSARGDHGRRPVLQIVLPPRTGKTVLAGHVIGLSGLTATRDGPTRVLVEQTRRLFGDASGVPVGEP